MSQAGDLGRRVLYRRTKLNLTIEQVAERAGMAAGYLEYLEQTPTAEPSNAAIVRLARALQMQNAELRGGDQGEAHGGGAAGRDPVLIDLHNSECQDLVRGGGVGRVVFRAEAKPVALPVNFRVVDDDIVFRSSNGGLISAIAPDEPVSFEVDRIDDAMSEGWSVLLTGTLHRVSDGEELAKAEAFEIEPWAGEDRSQYFCLHVSTRSGKRINAVR